MHLGEHDVIIQDSDVRYSVLETSAKSLHIWRHWNIFYDIAWRPWCLAGLTFIKMHV